MVNKIIINPPIFYFTQSQEVNIILMCVRVTSIHTISTYTHFTTPYHTPTPTTTPSPSILHQTTHNIITHHSVPTPIPSVTHHNPHSHTNIYTLTWYKRVYTLTHLHTHTLTHLHTYITHFGVTRP